MGALYYSDVATLFLRGRLAIICRLVTIRAGLRLLQIPRSASAPVGYCWNWQTGHSCQDKTNWLSSRQKILPVSTRRKRLRGFSASCTRAPRSSVVDREGQ